MSEETKKRWRPSLTAYRRLEDENRMLRDIIKGLGNMEEVVRDNVCYRQAMINFSSMIRARRDPAILCQGSEDCEAMIKIVYKDIRNRWDEDSDRLLQENRAYEMSNRLMEEELDKLRERNSSIEGEKTALGHRIQSLMSRGFWSRVFNREV